MKKEEQQTTSTFGNGLLWFGAAVSIAEIFTGSLIAPLGFSKGVLAILLGHLIGCPLLYFAGLIGAKSGLSAMESSRISFGEKGSYIFSVLNILQLVGWTAVMIVGAAKALGAVSVSLLGAELPLLWCVVTGALVAVWIVSGAKSLGKINTVAVGSLFVLTIVLSTLVFKPGMAGTMAIGSMSFGTAVELSVAMPLSWLPLVSDYTRRAKEPKQATLVSAATYFVGSSWMFAIGLGAAIFAGSSDVAQILMSAGLGLAALVVVILSTVTTTYLDVHSAGVSAANIGKKVPEKPAAIAVCIVGTLLAMFTPIEQYESFLLLIGSVFAPMTAILLTDYFILKKTQIAQSMNFVNIALWIVGFIVYRLFLSVDTVVGSTLPVMVIVSLLRIFVYGGMKICSKKS